MRKSEDAPILRGRRFLVATKMKPKPMPPKTMPKPAPMPRPMPAKTMPRKTGRRIRRGVDGY